jgi:hypothetical protein
MLFRNRIILREAVERDEAPTYYKIIPKMKQVKTHSSHIYTTVEKKIIAFNFWFKILFFWHTIQPHKNYAAPQHCT